MTEETLFDLILKTPESERAALLDRACDGKPELRLRVEALLKADAVPAKLLDQSPAFDATTGFEATASYAAGDTAGVYIAGRYKLLEEIGEGGMGTVWMAQQSEPVKRLVAIKLIKEGMDSKAVLSRFEAERQALAMMDHPNIAKVLDGGLTGEPGGVSPRRPYFVMELVKGTPITKFCDERKLSLKERLELFVPVCQAIQHAHQKGVIHRDIKPSNVLIALYDDKPVPKVIDFGVAKATGAQLTEQTLNTGFGAVVGTPEYMSPEQASLNNLDIDTRSDVYALGVLLYELLTGTTPVDRKSLKQAALMEVLRMVREVEAPRPSTRLSSSEALPSIAANRHTEPLKLSKLMKGELDWIVMKALEKDRSRRYETANGFAADVLRYLSGEPVTAVPPSAGYRVRKFVKRNKGKVVAAGLVALTLVLGIIGTTFGLLEARRHEAQSIEEAKEKDVAWQAEAKQRQAAEKRLTQVEKTNEILASIFRDLNPRTEGGEQVPLRELLARRLNLAAENLETGTIGDPLAVARLQNQLANSLREMSYLNRAIDLQTKALRTLDSMLGSNHPDTMTTINNLAETYNAAGQTAKAISLLEQLSSSLARRFGSEHDQTLSNLHNLALAYQSVGRLEDSIRVFEEVRATTAKVLGADAPKTLFVEVNLAGVYRYAGRASEGAIILERVRNLQERTLQPDHADLLITLHNLAGCYRALGRTAEAISLLESVWSRRAKTLGVDHQDTLASQNNLAGCYLDAGRTADAITQFESKLSRSTAKLGSDHPDTLTTRLNLALALMDVRQFEKALSHFQETSAGYQRTRQNEDSSRIAAMVAWGECLVLSGRPAEAETLLREALAIRERTSPGSALTFNAKSLLGNCLLKQKKYSEAEPLLVNGFQGMKTLEKTIPLNRKVRLYEALDRVIQVYTETNKPDEVKKWQAEKQKLPKLVEKK